MEYHVDLNMVVLNLIRDGVKNLVKDVLWILVRSARMEDHLMNNFKIFIRDDSTSAVRWIRWK